MNQDNGTIDIGAGMAWGAMAPALAGGLLGLAGGPAVALATFMAALPIAGMHVVVLALPLYGLLFIAGWQVNMATALVAASLIGALPATLLGGPELGVFGAMFGLIGGGAFCKMSVVRQEQGEGE